MNDTPRFVEVGPKAFMRGGSITAAGLVLIALGFGSGFFADGAGLSIHLGGNMARHEAFVVAGSVLDRANIPNATNTGVPSGVTLNASGGITITKAGTVVEGLNINGPVIIEADNVTLKNCKVTFTGYWGVYIKPGVDGATVQDTEINGTGSNNSGSHGILGTGTFLRNNIYNVENGITLNGGNTVIRDNYIHDLKASGAPHYDGIEVDGGTSNITIEHNTVINNHSQTSALMIDNYFGSVQNVKVDNNYLVGGGYTVYVDGQFSGGSISGVSLTNNYLQKGYYGYYSINNNSPVMSGNHEGVAPPDK